MKKLLSLVLAIAMILSVVTVVSFASTESQTVVEAGNAFVDFEDAADVDLFGATLGGTISHVADGGKEGTGALKFVGGNASQSWYTPHLTNANTKAVFTRAGKYKVTFDIMYEVLPSDNSTAMSYIFRYKEGTNGNASYNVVPNVEPGISATGVWATASAELTVSAAQLASEDLRFGFDSISNGSTFYIDNFKVEAVELDPLALEVTLTQAPTSSKMGIVVPANGFLSADDFAEDEDMKAVKIAITNLTGEKSAFQLKHTQEASYRDKLSYTTEKPANSEGYYNAPSTCIVLEDGETGVLTLMFPKEAYWYHTNEGLLVDTSDTYFSTAAIRVDKVNPENTASYLEWELDDKIIMAIEDADMNDKFVTGADAESSWKNSSKIAMAPVAYSEDIKNAFNPPVGVKFEVTEELVNAYGYFVLEHAFTADDVVDGNITLSYDFYNPTDAAVKVNLWLQNNWANIMEQVPTSRVTEELAPNSITTLTVSVPVNAENKVVIGDTTAEISALLLRVQFDDQNTENVPAGTYFVVAAEPGDILYSLSGGATYFVKDTGSYSGKVAKEILYELPEIEEEAGPTPTPAPTPNSVQIEVLEDTSYYLKSNTGKITNASVKDGVLTKTIYVTNIGEDDFKVNLLLQATVKNSEGKDTWAGFGAGYVDVPVKDTVKIEFECEVNDDGTVTILDQDVTLDKLFVRLDFNSQSQLYEGTKLIISGDKEIVDALVANASSAKVTYAAVIYDVKVDDGDVLPVAMIALVAVASVMAVVVVARKKKED